MKKNISYESRRRLARLKVGERTSISVNGAELHVSCRPTTDYMCDKCVLYDCDDKKQYNVLCRYAKCCMSRWRRDGQSVMFFELEREKGI